MIAPPPFLAKKIVESNLRSRFRRIFWNPPDFELPKPLIFAANHHTWHDGFLMFTALKALGLESRYLVHDHGAAGLFHSVGAIACPPDNPAAAAKAFRTCLTDLRNGVPLVIFPEGELHQPPELLPFQPGLARFSKLAGEAPVCPVAIKTELCKHERPEAWLIFRPLIPYSDSLTADVFASISGALSSLSQIQHQRQSGWKVLVEGKKSAHE